MASRKLDNGQRVQRKDLDCKYKYDFSPGYFVIKSLRGGDRRLRNEAGGKSRP
jgi:hypothetical protein